VLISSDDDTGSTDSDGTDDSEHDPDVDMRVEDDVNAPDGVDLNGDVDIERDSGDEVEEDEKNKDEEEEEEVDEEEEEDKDEDDGKERRTIGQGEIVNISGDDVDSMRDDQPIVLPEQYLEMCQHTPWPQPLAPAPWPQTADPCQPPQTPDTHPLRGLEHLGIAALQKPLLVVPTPRGAEAAGNTSDVDVD
jgi:hypothetical protein